MIFPPDILRFSLCTHLQEVKALDAIGDYDARQAAVLRVLAVASMLGYKVGFDFDDKWPDFPYVAMVDLPTGQVSWHMRPFGDAFDGHTTEEKYGRIDAYLRGEQ